MPISEQSSKAFHACTPEELLSALQSRPEGLSSQDARQRLAKFGANVLKSTSRDSPMKLLLRQINTPLIWVLLGSGILAVHYWFYPGI